MIPLFALGLPGVLALVLGLSLIAGCLAGTLIHAGAGDGGRRRRPGGDARPAVRGSASHERSGAGESRKLAGPR